MKQSLAYWCLNSSDWQWNVEQVCTLAKDLDFAGIDLLPAELFPIARKHGLICTLAFNGMPDPPFRYGLNNRRYHDQVIASTRAAIDNCAEFEVPNVIAFTGYKWVDADDPHSPEISRQEGFENTVAGLRQLAGYAAAKRVTLCLEHLNSRDDTHPMKGHPGYQGDDIDFCAAIIREVNSPSARLLFDAYHVQVMHGDVVRRIRQNRDVIGHVHTAGNPGRNEIDGTQELHYPAVLRALEEIGYQGYVGHEFIPTRDPREGFTFAAGIFR